MRLGDGHRVAGRAGRDPHAGQPSDGAQARAAGEQDPFRGDRAGGCLDAGDATVADDEARERRPLPQVDLRRLHGQRIGTDVARRRDAAIGRDVTAATMTGRRQGARDLGGFRCLEPARVEALGLLHRDAFVTGPLVVLGHREDHVAQLAEP